MNWKLCWKRSQLFGALFCLGGAIACAAEQSASFKGADPRPPEVSESSSVPADNSVDSHAREFRIGVGDVIHVSVWREAELTQTSVVRPDGRISMPLAGEVAVAGQTTLAAQELIRAMLLKYLTDPQVNLSVVEIHSRQVFITGQVQRPGAYPLLGSYSVLQLIASAGGLTPYAHKKSILVLDSNNHHIGQFNYSTAVKGEPVRVRDLLPGDTVVVP